jgi:hypothetical protein
MHFRSRVPLSTRVDPAALLRAAIEALGSCRWAISVLARQAPPRIDLLENPTNPYADAVRTDVQAAANAFGVDTGFVVQRDVVAAIVIVGTKWSISDGKFLGYKC